MKQIISSKYKCFVLFIEIFIVILLLPVIYNYIPVNHETKTLYIPSSNIDTIADTLEKNGYTVTWIDKIMLELIETPQTGWYTIQPDDNHGRFIFFMTLNQRKAKTMNIVVYPGETVKELIARLANDMKLDSKKLQKKYQTLTRFKEADIFAKRYTIARKADENTTMQYLFDLSRRALIRFQMDNFSEMPDTFTLKVLLTIASIIQKESNSVKEMPLISSVIHNRLAKDMRLQMDSTLNYGDYSHVIVTPEHIKSDKSYYNTYKHKGLPQYPLATVTMDALRSAMSPQKSDYLFFMLNKNGEHDFSATYDKHLENVRAFRVYQKERKKKKLQEQEDEKKKKKKKASTI